MVASSLTDVITKSTSIIPAATSLIDSDTEVENLRELEIKNGGSMSLNKLLIALLSMNLALVACSSNGSDSNKSQPAVTDSAQNKEKQDQAGNGEVNPRAPAAEASTVSRPPAEDLNILKKMVSNQLQMANQFLDVADKLSVTQYEVGNPISPDQCAQLEQTISKNYQFHVYEAVSSEKGYQDVKGVKICPTESVRNGSYIDTKGAWAKLSIKPVANSAGVQASKVLTVAYMPMFDGVYSTMFEQYLLDTKNRIIEHVQYRSLAKDGSESWNLVSAITKDGHLIGRVYRVYSDTKAPYIWKGASTFVANDGSVRLAMRVYQNDGKGNDAVKFSLGIPYQISWSQFEISPLTRLGGYYKIGGDVVTWPTSQAIYEWDKKGPDECGYGHIGYNKSGGSIREFGDIQCEKNLDLNTTRH